MSLEERGLYHMMLNKAWDQTPRGSLPADFNALRAVLGHIDPRTLRRLLPGTFPQTPGDLPEKSRRSRGEVSGKLAECWREIDGRLWNHRLAKEAEKTIGLSEKRALAGRVGGLAKATNLLKQKTSMPHPHPHKQEKKETKKEKSPPDSRSADAERVFVFWKETFKKAPRTKFLSDRRRKVISRLNEGTTEKEIRMAIVGCSISDFHRENGHNDLELICRNRTQIEKFIERIPIAAPDSAKAKNLLQEIGYFRTGDGQIFRKPKAPH